MESRIEVHHFPIGGSRVEINYSWKLFINGVCVARSADYFPSEHAAQIALDEFLAAAPGAPITSRPSPAAREHKPPPDGGVQQGET